jgi:hypothetical protein
MSSRALSALITEQGHRITLRLQGRYYQLSQDELRSVLGLPPGPPGLGISIDHDRICFEFPGDQQTVELTAAQLHRRLAKQSISPA